MGYILEINGLTKIYPAFELKLVSFHIKAGEVMGFIGRNGAGKTTTLKAILNLVHPDAGSVCILGMNYPDNEDKIKQPFKEMTELFISICSVPLIFCLQNQ